MVDVMVNDDVPCCESAADGRCYQKRTPRRRARRWRWWTTGTSRATRGRPSAASAALARKQACPNSMYSYSPQIREFLWLFAGYIPILSCYIHWNGLFETRYLFILVCLYSFCFCIQNMLDIWNELIVSDTFLSRICQKVEMDVGVCIWYHAINAPK